MNGVGDQLLAGAVFALDENVGFRVGHRIHQVEELAHLPAAPDDVLELVAVAQLPPEGDVLGFEFGTLDGAAEHRQDALAVNRLFEEVRSRRP